PVQWPGRRGSRRAPSAAPTGAPLERHVQVPRRRRAGRAVLRRPGARQRRDRSRRVLHLPGDMTRWSADYKQATGRQVNHQWIGSGGGIAQIKAGTVDFGSSDAPLPPEELAKCNLAQFPSVIGGVVPIVNVQGVAPGALKLDGHTLAGIFLGRITRWNDPAIAALNRGLALPDTKITVVHRSDGSGTTFNFVNYLSKISPEWKQKVGEGTSVQWPTGIGGKGNEGVAAYVKQIKGGIGYVELSYALQNKLSHVQLKNAAGRFVQPSDETFAAAAASAEWGKAQDFYLVMTNA